jgi:hypothetical protein
MDMNKIEIDVIILFKGRVKTNSVYQNAQASLYHDICK